MFKVFAEIEFGPDDTAGVEYTGNRYATYDEAKPELIDARKDPEIIFAWIEEVD